MEGMHGGMQHGEMMGGGSMGPSGGGDAMGMMPPPSRAAVEDGRGLVTPLAEDAGVQAATGGFGGD